jgi:hypothetical protein
VGQEPEERGKNRQEPDGGTLDVDEVSIVSQSVFPWGPWGGGAAKFGYPTIS